MAKKSVKCPTCGASIWLYSLGTHLVEKHGFKQCQQKRDSYDKWYGVRILIRNKEEIK